MANVSVTNSFVGGTKAKASEVNTNFTDLTTWLNNRNQATADWDDFACAAGIEVKATTNQFVLGATRTVTITAPTPASASRTHTIPDVSADSNFIMSQSSQQITAATMTLRNDQADFTQWLIRNHTVNAAAHAGVQCYIDSISAGDPKMIFGINGGTSWTLGGDNSDSDSFKISKGSALGTDDYFTLTSAGKAAFTVGPFGVGVDPTAIIQARLDQNAGTHCLIQNYNASSGANAGFYAYVDSTTGGDAILKMDIGGASLAWTLGVDNSDSDTFKIAQNGTLGTNDFLTISTAGLVALGSGSAAVNVRINSQAGGGVATGTLTNAPAAGNPTVWIKVNINGTDRQIPAW